MSTFPHIELENNMNQPNSKDHNPEVGGSNLLSPSFCLSHEFSPELSGVHSIISLILEVLVGSGWLLHMLYMSFSYCITVF
jgi:hypothetical protein